MGDRDINPHDPGLVIWKGIFITPMMRISLKHMVGSVVTNVMKYSM